MESEFTLRNDLASLLEQVKQLEPLIYAANDGRSRAYFEKLLSLEFWEIGASGREYTRDFVLDVLEERQKSPVIEEWKASDFHLQELGNQTYLFTYTLHQPTRKSKRATIWRKTEGDWSMVYHQGTVIV